MTAAYRSEYPSSRRGGRGRRWTAGVLAGVVVVAAATAAGVVLYRRHSADQAAQAATDALVRAWTAGSWDGVAVQGSSSAAVATDYARIVKGLGDAHPSVTVTGRHVTGDRLTDDLSVTWTFPGGARWTYATTADFFRPSGSWLLAWSPTVVHPKLGAGDQLAAVRTLATRAPIEGRGGTPLVTERPVVDVGINPTKATNLHQLAQQLGALLGVDAVQLEQRARAAGPNQLVPVIVLREADYVPLRTQLRALPGVVLQDDQLPLAPTRSFARSLLGTVGPATQELVAGSNGRVAATDTTGLSGLSLQYDAQLAGTAGIRVDLLHTDDTGTTAATTLWSVAPVAGQPVQTTLDARVQEAADNAVAGTTSPSALVAVDVATGDVLAVAVGPDAGGYDTALLGQYSPGSTFKIVTTLALLRHGLSIDEPVACPEFATVDGKTFHNYNHEVLGTVPFHRDFAQSCNTAFIGLSSRLGPSDLAQAAASLGVGVPWTVGTPAFSGNVPTGETGVNLAAAAFGQGQVTVSPLAMAVAAASIAHGGTVTPHLVLSASPTGTSGTSASASSSASAVTASPVEPAQAATIASLMREVVTSGTGTVLNGLPGGPVAAKTGTAEYGTANPPQTHAWMVGFQGGIAFAAFVHDGATGAGTAGPIVESFLRALAGG